jgi:hypothetical protein
VFFIPPAAARGIPTAEEGFLFSACAIRMSGALPALSSNRPAWAGASGAARPAGVSWRRPAFATGIEPLLACSFLTEVEWFFAARSPREAAREELTVPAARRAAIRMLTRLRVRFLGPVKTSLPFQCVCYGRHPDWHGPQSGVRPPGGQPPQTPYRKYHAQSLQASPKPSFFFRKSFAGGAEPRIEARSWRRGLAGAPALSAGSGGRRGRATKLTRGETAR